MGRQRVSLSLCWVVPCSNDRVFLVQVEAWGPPRPAGQAGVTEVAAFRVWDSEAEPLHTEQGQEGHGADTRGAAGTPQGQRGD